MSNLDKNIKNKLEGYSSEVNPNMWAKIEAGLPQVEQTTTRNILWPIFGIALLTTLLVGFYLMNLDSVSTIEMNDSTLNNKNSDKALVSEITGNSNSPTLDLKSDIINEDEENHLISDSRDKQNLDVSLSQINSNLKNKSLNILDFKTNNDQFKNKEHQALNQNNSSLDNVIIEKPVSTSLYQQYNSILKATKSNMEGNIKIIEREEEDLETLDFYPTKLNTNSSDINFILDGMMSKRTICPTFKNVRFGIFAEAFYSNDFGLRDLSYNYLGDGNYLEARNRTEAANYSFSTGARVSFIMPNGLGAKTGITYSQINESFKYLDESHRKTKTIIIKEYIWENNVIIDSVSNSEEIEVEGALNIKSQNKYKSIDLPLLITYEWGYKNRLYYSITGGPMFNIKFSQKGIFLNPETLSPVDFTTGEGNYQAFNTNVGTSVYLAFALNYQLGNGADFFIEPNMRHNLKSTTLNSYELNQKHTVFGLGFGIKYKL